VIGYIVFDILSIEAKTTIQQQLKNGIPTQKLHRFNFKVGEPPHWTITNKEFILNGEMYDIVKIEKQATHTIYYCITDKEETSLNAKLGCLVLKQVTKKCNPDESSIVNLLRTDYLNNTHPVVIAKLTPLFKSSKPLVPYCFTVLEENIEIDSPPPLNFS
jgi:hypothetical protein